MIFIINKAPLSSIELQSQLKQASRQAVEVYLSIEEAEANLYKLPDIVLVDDSIELTDLLYITQSIKAYDSSTQIIWMCREKAYELEKMHKSYGVACCLKKSEGLLERLSLSILEAHQQANRCQTQAKRRNHFRKHLLESCPDSYSLL